MTETRKLTGAEVAELVECYRKASKSLRGLKTDHFGNVNVDTAQRHTRTMLDVWGRLTQDGHKRLADLLSQWHSALKRVPYEWTENRVWALRDEARRASKMINREVERIQ